MWYRDKSTDGRLALCMPHALAKPSVTESFDSADDLNVTVGG